MDSRLSHKKVAILVDNGFEQVELTEPKRALDDLGAQTFIVSPRPARVRGWKFSDWGDQFHVDISIEDARAEDYDALVLPGGVMNPDQLRMNPKAVSFVKGFIDAGKPVAAICHGPWTLIETGAVRGRRMTSYPSIKSDLRNAGANGSTRRWLSSGIW